MSTKFVKTIIITESILSYALNLQEKKIYTHSNLYIYKIFFPGKIQIPKTEASGGEHREIRRAISQMAKDKTIVHYKIKYYFYKIQPSKKNLYIVVGTIDMFCKYTHTYETKGNR